ncbi:DoxX family protein [Pinibacter aurantiacus]|uniref:DoxX family protein n=1 Tax=Pinibacter aurantiacus TaxID=2851599 RepID=A0A9E2W2V5_9BACT|nr:DoxX family protein [Pinibacter aurantiacus]MBV4355518.1 DoxX family protein [Pinibacter aurantiacus]
MTKTQKIIYWISTAWLALGMISTGAVQLMKTKTGAGGYDSVVNTLGFPAYMLTLLGVLKIVGAIVVLIPKFPLLKEWAYAGFFFIMAGALFSHIAAGDTSAGAIFPVILLLTLTAVSWYFRPAERKLLAVASSR